VGDVLFSKDGTIGRTVVVRDDRDFAVASSLIIIRPRSSSLDSNFLHRLCQSNSVASQVESFVKGAGLPRLSIQNLLKVIGCFPPLPEQRQIAAFLDRECGKLDALQAKQERLIELLKEKRQTLISHAVTRGLDPAAKLKPSGIEWLGDVPGPWCVGNLKYFAAMKTGHTPSRSNLAYWQDCHIPWFTLADVWQLRSGKQSHLGKTKAAISDLGLANSAAELLPAGTVVLSRTASVGFSGIMPRPMATSQDFWNWICGPKLDPMFLLMLFRAMKPYFNSLMMGSTHKTIYQADAASIQIPLPPLAEQRAIVAHLDEKCGKIDQLKAKAERAIELLRERRSALISAAVTGKIDVRES
jgi:type I restriction enzyme, S subunit